MPSETILQEFETDSGETYAFISIEEVNGGTSWIIERRYADGNIRRTSPMISPEPYERAFDAIMAREMGA